MWGIIFQIRWRPRYNWKYYCASTLINDGIFLFIRRTVVWSISLIFLINTWYLWFWTMDWIEWVYFREFDFSHTFSIFDFQVLITLVHILWAFCMLNLFKNLNISTWLLFFEKSTLLRLVPCASIFLAIPKTSSLVQDGVNYFWNPKISIPKSFQRDLHLFVQWIEALSSQIVMDFDVLTQHLSM